MPRDTLQSGDIWSENAANAAGFPVLDGADEYGHGPKAIDDWLSDAPNHIKALFYAWYQRVQVESAGGLNVSHTGALVTLANGSQVTLAAGVVTLPASSAVYIYITDEGQVSHGADLPGTGVILAFATTDAAAVTELRDLRAQVSEQVRPIKEANFAGFDVGDIKFSARQLPSVGWAICDETTLYTQESYPVAYAQIGARYSRPGDPPNTFRTPPPDRVPVGAGGKYALGELGGEDSVKLTAATGFKHSHVIDETAHTHQSSGVPHAHTAFQSPHAHLILGSTERSDGRVDSIVRENAAVAGEEGGTFVYVSKNAGGTDIISTMQPAVTVQPQQANVNIATTKTGASAQSSGEGKGHENRMPFSALNQFIRLF